MVAASACRRLGIRGALLLLLAPSLMPLSGAGVWAGVAPAAPADDQASPSPATPAAGRPAAIPTTQPEPGIGVGSVPSAGAAPVAAGQPRRWLPQELELKADQISYDSDLQRVVARGNATVLLAGGRLITDRLEFDPASQILYASGSVRLQRGQQYLQASRLRYHLIEANGEAEDVYGVLDLEAGRQDFKLDRPPSQPLPPPEPISCPPDLPAAPQQRLWPLSLVGLGSAKLPPPPLPPARGCREAPQGESQPLSDLPRLLEDVAMGPVPSDPARAVSPQPLPPASGSAAEQRQRRDAAIAQIDQRVENVRFRQSLTLEQRFGGQAQGITTTTTGINQFGQTRLVYPQTLDLGSNQELLRGTISRWRFQARRVRLSPTQLLADRMALSNDPFTPAQTWLDAQNVVATLMANGDTQITSSLNRVVLDDRLALPVGRRRARIKARDDIENRWVIALDSLDRDGVYTGYNLGPYGIGANLKLELQPQFMLQRAVSGTVNSYPLPGQSAIGPSGSQSVQLGDLFGLTASLKGPFAGFNQDLNLNVSSFNPDNIGNATRSWGSLSRWLSLPLVGNSLLRLFGAYRFRSWNGSLGEQDIYSAYGASLEQAGNFPNWGKMSSNYYWRVGTGNFQGSQYLATNLIDLWRTSFYGSINSSLPLWLGKTLPATATQGLLNSPAPVQPGLWLNTSINALLANYSDGSYQNTLTLNIGPTLSLGHFSRRWFDYTQLSVTGGFTVLGGGSPLAFDRAVDLATINFGLSQQLVGPLMFVGGLGINIDPASTAYGQITGSYMELRWQRRAYEVGIYYSPYEQLGGLRIRLNDLSFDGPGVPFVPYTRMPTLAGQAASPPPF
ncbi:MAG: DUF3769 domain-containing protein [Cyanobium sp.]